MSDARLFLALWPDEELRATLARWRDAWSWPRGAGPVADGKLHLTLHFLGAVPQDRIPELVEAFHVPFRPFSLTLGAPHLWHSSIAVLEPLAIPSELSELHAALAERVAALGLPLEERSYKPHVTLARRAHGALVPPPAPALAWRVHGYALVESKLTTDGSYHVLHTYGTQTVA